MIERRNIIYEARHLDIVKNTYNNCKMCGSRGSHKLTDTMNNIRDVKSSNCE